MRVAVYIQNHYKRDPSGLVKELEQQIGDMPIKVNVATDQTDYYTLPHTSKSKYVGLNKNFFNRIVGADNDELDWKISVQDDMTITNNFIGNTLAIIENLPTDVPIFIQLYVPDLARVREAEGNLLHIKDGQANVCAVVYNTAFASSLHSWFIEQPLIEQYNEGEDFLIRKFYKQTKSFSNFMIKPSLSQHSDGGNSILKHPSKTGKFSRVSMQFDKDFIFDDETLDNIVSNIKGTL